jgi:hypothetical protein
MSAFAGSDVARSFGRFERAAAKGHEESIWILGVVKGVEMKKGDLIEAFAKTDKPLGWFFAGYLSDGREEFDFFKKSAEGGCSWGQVGYGLYFTRGLHVEKDRKMFLEWLEKATNQNNPSAMNFYTNWFRAEGYDSDRASSYCLAGAELGWKQSMDSLAVMLRYGEGCTMDLRQAAIWGAKGDSGLFWDQLEEAKEALESGATEDLECDFDQLCYSLGWGLYWYQYGGKDWNEQDDKDRAFGNRCLDYYCSCVELQRESIFTFLLFWNRMTGGIKGPGQMIAQMAWEGREDNLLKGFERSE